MHVIDEPEVGDDEINVSSFKPAWRRHWDRFRRQTQADSYHLTRFLILRLLGFVYVSAFVSLLGQLLPLLGEDGLTPASVYLRRLTTLYGSAVEAFIKVPTFFFVDASDSSLFFFASLGLVLSVIVFLGFANSIVMTILWALYMSFVHVGQVWYGYGWEIELLENGFLAIFLCPLLDGRPLSNKPTPLTVIVLYRWLAFRIMFGAGLIKLRGDDCWRELTCLKFHYETQPIPNPVSPYLHNFPEWFHKSGVLFNHFVEIVLPFFVFGPRRARLGAGILLVFFQVFLIISGNLSFLNWLTLIPMFACFDDRFLRLCLRRGNKDRGQRTQPLSRSKRVTLIALTVLVAVLSLNPISNLVSAKQVMNTSFDSLSLVNSYGAFGTVGKVRHEIIFEGTTDKDITELTRWRAYEFPCKPGDPMRRPCVSGSYQRRLDWQIWFAAMSDPQSEPWTVHLIWKLLHNDEGVLSLLANNPFPDTPPYSIRAVLYRYEFAPLDDMSGAWWKREIVRAWLPPLSRDDPRLKQFLTAYGWHAKSIE
jgi:hypothetical protein